MFNEIETWGGDPQPPFLTQLVFIWKGEVGGDPPPPPLFIPLLFYEKEDVAVLRCVAVVTQWLRRGHTVVPPWSHHGATVVPPWCHRGHTMMTP